MSWSVEYTTEGNTEISLLGDESPEALAAMKVAVDVVGEILDSEVLGNKTTKRFRVNITGHSNPDNEPSPGWSNDYVNINVYQMEESK